METPSSLELRPDHEYLQRLITNRNTLFQQATEKGICTDNLAIPTNPKEMEELHLQMQQILHPNAKIHQPIPWDEQPIIMRVNDSLITRTLLTPNNHRLAEGIFPKQINFSNEYPWITYTPPSHTQNKQPLFSYLSNQHSHPASALAGIAKINQGPSYYNQALAWRLLFLIQNFQNTTEIPDHLTIFSTIRLKNELENHKPASWRLQQFAQQTNLPIDFIGQVDRPFPTALAIINLPSAQIPKIQNTLWKTLSQS